MSRPLSRRVPRPELLAFLRAAKQDPDDDLPRLVLADWLEDQGDPSSMDRAELLRVQCALARTPEADPRHQELHARAEALLARHSADWCGPLASLGGKWSFERGLLRLEGPPVESLVGSAGAELAAGEPCAWLERLDLRSSNEGGVSQLLSSPVLEHLGGLMIASSALGPRAARALAGAAGLSQLRALDLNYNSIGNDGVLALSTSPHLKGLTHLELWINRLGPEGAEALGRSGLRLRYLNLGGNVLGPDGAAALARSPVLECVATMLLWGNNIGPDGLEALVASPFLTRLAVLYLNENHLGDQGAFALARWAQAPRLQTLSLWGNELGREGAWALAETPLTSLTTLLLNDNPLGDEGVAALARSPHLANLTHLDLHGTGFGTAGAHALAEAHFPQLVELNVRSSIEPGAQQILRDRFGPVVIL